MQEKLATLFNIAAPDSAVIETKSIISQLPKESYPKPDADYIFRPILLKKLLRFFYGQAARKNLFLIGPAGAGKSSVAVEVAARLKWPVFSMACSGKTRFAHMVGSRELKNGETIWKDGPLTLAMRFGGLFLANEISRLDPGEQMNLAEILDGRAVLTIPDTGEIVEAHPDFRFIATGNSGGYGDQSGAYIGERPSSFAFLDRFQKLVIDYPTVEEENLLIERKAPELPELLRTMMVRLAQETRKGFVGAGGALRVVISTRSLCCWAQETVGYTAIPSITDPVHEALMATVLNGAPQDDIDVVVGIMNQWLKPQ